MLTSFQIPFSTNIKISFQNTYFLKYHLLKNDKFQYYSLFILKYHPFKKCQISILFLKYHLLKNVNIIHFNNKYQNSITI